MCASWKRKWLSLMHLGAGAALSHGKLWSLVKTPWGLLAASRCTHWRECTGACIARPEVQGTAEEKRAPLERRHQ